MTTATLEIDRAQADRAFDLLLTGILKQATLAVGGQTRGLEKDLEVATRINVRGRLWRAWKSETFPRGGRPAYEPTGSVFVNGGDRAQGAVHYWTEAGVNRARSGKYLAVPTPEAGIGRRGRPLAPEEWEWRHGAKLHFDPRGAGKPALLIARQTVYSGAGAIARDRRSRGRAVNADGSATRTRDVVVFVLIPVQRFANKFSIAPIIARREKMLAEDFEARLAKVARADIRAR